MPAMEPTVKLVELFCSLADNIYRNTGVSAPMVVSVCPEVFDRLHSELGHVFRHNLLQPDGKKLSWYADLRRTITLEAETGQVTVIREETRA